MTETKPEKANEVKLIPIPAGPVKIGNTVLMPEEVKVLNQLLIAYKNDSDSGRSTTAKAVSGVSTAVVSFVEVLVAVLMSEDLAAYGGIKLTGAGIAAGAAVPLVGEPSSCLKIQTPGDAGLAQENGIWLANRLTSEAEGVATAVTAAPYVTQKVTYRATYEFLDGVFEISKSEGEMQAKGLLKNPAFWSLRKKLLSDKSILQTIEVPYRDGDPFSGNNIEDFEKHGFIQIVACGVPTHKPNAEYLLGTLDVLDAPVPRTPAAPQKPQRAAAPAH